MTGPKRKTRRRGLLEIFAIPALLFIISLGGLVAALLIEGWADAGAGVVAGAGLLATVWALASR